MVASFTLHRGRFVHHVQGHKPDYLEGALGK